MRDVVGRLATVAGLLALEGKYGNVLGPFVALMEAELHANAGKGDRPGWLTMTPEVGMLEIYYHAAKLQKAVKHHDVPSIREYAADVANMAMMLRQRFYKRHLPPIPTDSHQILTRNRQESQITGRRNGVADGARTQTARTPTIPRSPPFIGARRFSAP